MATTKTSDPPFNINDWSCAMTRWLDQINTAHLRKEDGSPACGARYYCMGGPFDGIDRVPKCRNCERIWRARWRRANA